MANRAKGFGLSAEIKNKIASKYDLELERQAREWIEEVTGEQIFNHEEYPWVDDVSTSSKNFHSLLKDGKILCRLMNIINPGAIKKINESSMAFKQMENISHFLEAIEKYGVKKVDLFQTVDLYEKQNLGLVVTCIHALGRMAQKNGFDGPVLGPKEATQNKRQFSEEQMQEGKKVIGLQMGTNKGASQAGMSFGTQRHINDINVGEGSKEGQNVIGLQMGTNKGASASGINMGKTRHIID